MRGEERILQDCVSLYALYSASTLGLMGCSFEGQSFSLIYTGTYLGGIKANDRGPLFMRRVVAERLIVRIRAFGVSDQCRMWVKVPVVGLVSLSKLLYHNCVVLQMGH